MSPFAPQSKALSTHVKPITAVFAALLLALLAAASDAADEARATEAGIHKISSEHLTLYTDADGPEIDRLPRAFDQAFGQWCRYFGLKEAARTPIGARSGA